MLRHAGRRLHTKPSEGLDLDPDQVSSFSANGSYDDASPWGSAARHLLQRQGVPLMFSADKLWEQGFRGQGVKMGVFDTGIRADHPHVKNIRSEQLVSLNSPCAELRHAANACLGLV